MEQKNNKEKKFQFSKMIVFFAGIIFILTLGFCLYAMLNAELDVTMGVGAISTTGCIFLSSIVWYMKKSQPENVIKLKYSYTERIMALQYEYYEKKLRLQKELGISDEEEMNFMVDDLCDESIDSDMAYLEEKFDESAADPEIQMISM